MLSSRWLRHWGVIAEYILQRGFEAREVILDCNPEDQLIHSFVDMNDSVAGTHDAAEIGDDVKNAGTGIQGPLECLSDDFELAFYC
nr:hypothetical protein [Synechococcus sp. CS-1325]